MSRRGGVFDDSQARGRHRRRDERHAFRIDAAKVEDREGTADRVHGSDRRESHSADLVPAIPEANAIRGHGDYSLEQVKTGGQVASDDERAGGRWDREVDDVTLGHWKPRPQPVHAERKAPRVVPGEARRRETGPGSPAV
jgi:hypothetical protein